MRDDQVVDEKVHLLPVSQMTPSQLAKWLLLNQDSIENVVMAVTMKDSQPSCIFRSTMPLKDLCYLGRLVDEEVREAMYED